MRKVSALPVFAFFCSSLLAFQQVEDWDTTKPRGQTREIDFTTSEGTWMSVDISPDGRWLVFDLLAHVYRVPVEGGQAEVLTQDSGVALNYHPRYSPDGTQIAFVSDRKGQNNLWVMDADGSNPRPVFTDLNVQVVGPHWTPDGEYIVVRRRAESGSGIWIYHKDGGEGTELVGSDVSGAAWPTITRDGRFLYFQVSEATRDFIGGSRQLSRLDLETGEITPVTEGVAAQQSRGSSGGAIAPEISPDGRWLAFARRIPNGTVSWKGHEFGPRTALFLRDLKTGSEHLVMDPITVDMAEGMKTLRVLPGYAWAPDGRSIVLSQGGKLRRLWIDTDRIRQGSWEPVVDTIPVTARVRRTISEMAWKPMPLSDGAFQSRFHRWWTASPDGRVLAFQAVGRIWLAELAGGEPRRLTSSDFEPLEFAPSWSPDGRWLAFTTFDDIERGHVWKIAASGGPPQRLSEEPGEYFNPVWSPDGSYLVVAQGSGATARGRMMAANAWYDLARLPADGGPTEAIARVPARDGRLIVRASFGPEGRVFYPEIDVEERQPRTRLVSVAADGSDRRVHMTFPFADEVVPSPDGKRVAFQQGGNVYLVPLLSQMKEGEPIHVERSGGKLPVEQLTKEGGMFPRWRDEKTLELGTANFYMRYDTDSEEMSTVEIDLQYPRRIPAGRIAFQGARIVTLENRQVIEKGDVVIDGSRITCVGDCDLAAADQVFDATGRTIVPGFWDLHAHHYRDYGGVETRTGFETAVYLAYGVTSNLEPYVWSHNVFPVAELVEAGELLGPRTFTTADAMSRGDGPFNNDVTSLEVAEQEVARRKAYGAVFAKQYALPRRDQRQWVVEAARRHGLKVTSEGGDLAANLGMIMDGQTAWEHPLSYVPLHGDAARFFGKAGAYYSPTVIVGGAGAWNEEYFFQESEIWRDPKQQRFLSWRYLIPHTRRRMLRPVTDYSYPMIAQGLADIIAEGGYGVPGGHGQHSGIGTHWEIWMYASALGPMGALEVASLHPARYLGVLEDTGSIRVGKLADLLVLRENPLENIRNTDSIEYVVKGGIVWEGDTLDEVWPEKRPFGEYYWVDEKMLREDTKPVDYWDRTPR